MLLEEERSLVKETAPGVLFAPAAPGNNRELTTIALKTEPVHLFLVFFFNRIPPYLVTPYKMCIPPSDWNRLSFSMLYVKCRQSYIQILSHSVENRMKLKNNQFVIGIKLLFSLYRLRE